MPMSSAHARLSSSRSLQSPKIAWYVLRECAVYFSIALFTFTGVLLTVRMLRFASLVINRGVEFSQIGTVFLALIPTFLEIAIPLATLLGVMLAIARLSGDSEIIVLRAAGVSIYQLVIPVLLFGVLTAVATLGISLYARPYGFQLLQNTLFEIARTRSTASLSPGIFNNMGNLTIYADKIDSHSGMLQRVLIDDRRAADTRKVIVAQRGKVISNLEEREIQLYLEDGEMHENLANGHYGITHFDQNSVAMDTDELRDPDSSQRGRGSREMFMSELRLQIGRHRLAWERIKHGEAREPDDLPSATSLPQERTISLPVIGGGNAVIRPTGVADDPLLSLSARDAKRKYNRLRLERALRYAMPCAALILALVALPLGIQPPRAQRTWGAGLSALLGLAVFVLYYAVLSIGSMLCENGQLNPDLCAWLPNIVAMGIAVFAIQRMGSERWHSISHGIELSIAKLWGLRLGQRKARTA